MTRKPVALSILLVVVALAVAACSAPTTLTGDNSTSAPPGEVALTRTDGQGAVEFAVTPLNLSAPGDTLDFDIVMNTHSVDLAWNLAAQSTLTTDTGLEVSGQGWPVGSGHHYEGTLSFPARTAEGKLLLEGAKTLTLTILDTDVAERKFVWELSR